MTVENRDSRECQCELYARHGVEHPRGARDCAFATTPQGDAATTVEQAVRAAAAVIVESVASVLQEDPHQWSERPCATCRTITGIVGKPFGCYEFARARAARKGAR